MTKKCLLIVICIVCALVFGLGECDTIYADTVRSTGENEYTITYAVPEGGWSTITFRVQLSEQFTYNYSSKKNVFKRHEKLYLWKTAYATTNYSYLPFYTTCDGGMFTGGTEGSTFHSLTLNLK